jgi:hypothetical protein
MLSALDFYLEKPKEIVIIGKADEPATRELLIGLHLSYLPNSTLQLVRPDESIGEIAPLLEGKHQVNGKATTYVCHNFTCSAPVSSWDELRQLLDS